MENFVNHIDTHVLNWVIAHRTPVGNSICQALAQGFTPTNVCILAIVVGLFMAFKLRSVALGATVPLIVLESGIICQVVKQIVQRHRPPLADQIGHETDFSFPSGHTTGIIAIAMAVTLVVVYVRSRSAVATSELTAVATSSRLAAQGSAVSEPRVHMTDLQGNTASNPNARTTHLHESASGAPVALASRQQGIEPSAPATLASRQQGRSAGAPAIVAVAVLWILAIAVSLSRIYVAAHWTSDVVAGVILAVVVSAVHWFVVQKWGINTWIDSHISVGRRQSDYKPRHRARHQASGGSKGSLFFT